MRGKLSQAQVLLSMPGCSFPAVVRSFVFTLHLSWRQDHTSPYSPTSSPVAEGVLLPQCMGLAPQAQARSCARAARLWGQILGAVTSVIVMWLCGGG